MTLKCKGTCTRTKTDELVHIYHWKDTGTYYIHHTVEGKRVRKKIRSRLPDPKLAKKEIEYELIKGTIPAVPSNISVSNFARKYLQSIKATKAKKTFTWYGRKISLYPLIASALYVGLQKKELLYLEREDIDF